MENIVSLTDRDLTPLLHLERKRTDVESCIKSYATGHVAMDIAIGLAGFLPVPGAGIASIAAAIAAQAPIVYNPISRDIASIYHAAPGKVELGEVTLGALKGGALDLAAAFGTGFFTEIASDLVREIGASFALAWVPILGGFVSTALDAKIAWTMTWRVGLMLALYHENGGKWIESRANTYTLAKRFIKLDKAEGQTGPSIAAFVRQSTVHEEQVASVRVLVGMLKTAGLSNDAIRTTLLAQGVPPEVIAAALG